MSTPSFKAMSFNIWHDHLWESRKRLVVETIRDQAPDVLGLQEALLSQLEYLTTELPQYGFIGAGRDDGQRRGESVGILYRKGRLDVSASGTFWFSDQPEVPGSMPGNDWGSPNYPRIATWLRLLDKNTGKHFYHFNVHLQHDAGTNPDLARQRSVELLLARIASRKFDDPVVVTGDFNATENEVPIRKITERASMLDSQRTQASGWVAGTRCVAGDDRGRRIDYVFIDRRGKVHNVVPGQKISGQCASDHHFVLATVSF